ncbi:site-specific DNA-methyltransferase [Paenibacillus endoradicis]|uniref:site-specific DNA-methyltransferase n=1 Tax=Paenibacillus endoradicis TaxID=2972487 RepID=UPI0021599E44|nr:site-specific DNA-methyltransferase [Paenibacillus endoradicis]MCR8658807.1 site-specific DNA-methyltransferase [Paenibacillus endoradicis]
MINLISALPNIISESQCEVTYILENLHHSSDIELRNSEYIIPNHSPNKTKRIDDTIMLSKDWTNQLIYGDNLLAMQALLADHSATGQPSLRGKIDLIYIDPPFDSGVDYRSQHTISSSNKEYSTVMTQIAYSDSWKDGTVSYLRMICPRLMLMRELLSETGSIYVHIDWHVGHYVKILLDEIFGRDQFRNELVWQRDAVGKGAKKVSKQWSRELESIYVYSKSDKMYFQQPYLPTDQLTYTQLKEFRYAEEDGRKFKIVTLGDYSQQSIEQMRSNNLIYTTSSGKQYKKYYLDEFQLAIGSLWNDIPNLSHGRNNERLHYETQKPEKLLERIIEASTPRDGLVADFFSGSGTTAAVAEKLGRRWISSDLGKSAIMTSRKRLHQICRKPFIYQILSRLEREQVLEGSSYNAEQHAYYILQSFGAKPIADQLEGYYYGSFPNTNTVVFVDLDNKFKNLLSIELIKRQCTELYNKIIILGWSFDHKLIESGRYEGIELYIIPEQLRYYSNNFISSQKVLQAMNLKFSPVSILKLCSPTIEIYDDEWLHIHLQLENYRSLAAHYSISAYPELHNIMEQDPLALIEYWSVDSDYDGQLFFSQWREHRQHVHKKETNYRVATSLKITIPRKYGQRTICVKAYDIFGYESEWSTTLIDNDIFQGGDKHSKNI